MTSCHLNKTETKSADLSPINWKLITADSQLSFVTTKNKTFTEEHSIKFSAGYINDDRQLLVEAELSTVDTQIEIRDQRLRDILFEVEQFPLAKISSTLDRKLPLMEPFKVDFDLDLHGISKAMSALIIIQSVGDQLVVTNFEPVLVNGKDFALDGAINQLTKIAGLQSIDYSVLVDFKLIFEK